MIDSNILTGIENYIQYMYSMFGKTVSPISVLSTNEMLAGFGVDFTEGQRVVDVGGGLSTLGAVVQQEGGNYTSMDTIYRYSQVWLTKAFVDTVNPLIAKHLYKKERIHYLYQKLEELAHIFHGHPLLTKEYFGLTRDSAEKRMLTMQTYLETWYGEGKKELLLTDQTRYFDFLVAQYYGSTHRDLRSKEWLYKLVRWIDSGGTSAPSWLSVLGDTPKVLYEAYIAGKEQKGIMIEHTEQLRRVDFLFHERLTSVLSDTPKYSRSRATFIPSTAQASSPDRFATADHIFCNFVLHGLASQDKQTLLNFVREHMSEKATMYITIPEEDTATTGGLYAAGGKNEEGIVYWTGSKHDLEKLCI